MPRDGVELAAELGDPPRVRDVLRDDRQRDGRLRRDDHLLVGVGVVEVVVVAVGIRVAPGVALAVDLDVQRPAVRRPRLVGRRVLDVDDALRRVSVGVGVGRVADAREHGERHDGEHDEDHGGAERPADLQARVAADLRGHRVLARAEPDQRVEQDALDADEDDRRDREDDLVERVDVVGVRRAARLRRDEVRRCARGEHEGACQPREEREREDAAAGSKAGGSQGGGHSIHAAAMCCARAARGHRPGVPAIMRRRTSAGASRGTR